MKIKKETIDFLLDVSPELLVKVNVLKGSRQGELNARSKLKENEVIEIKQRIVNQEILTAIGRDYGVSRHAISKIKHKKTEENCFRS